MEEGVKQCLVSDFLTITVNQTADTARKALQATGWNLEEAVELFYSGDQRRSRASFDDDDGGVPPPLPVIRQTLYNDLELHQARWLEAQGIDPVVADRDYEEENRDNDWSMTENDTSPLVALYRPPTDLTFKGDFEKAKRAGAAQNKWLLVNLQSTTEFDSHKLNRDTWANETVAQTIKTNFIFWQENTNTTEGKKVCTYYRIESAPVVLVIDPVTGQKMKSWSGMIDPEVLLERIWGYTETTPMESLQPRPREFPNKPAIVKVPVQSSVEAMDEELQRALALSMADQVDSADEDMVAVEEEEEETCCKPVYPALPEEPKADGSLLCRVGFRLPDGRRAQRNFLPTDPVQLLWSFCSSQLGEADSRPFRLCHAVPGASKALEYDSKTTFEESKLANSLLTVSWE